MNRRRKSRPATQSIPMSRFKATVLLIFFYITIWGILLGSGFNAFGKLPSQVLVFASTIAAVITFLGALWGFLIGPSDETLKNFLGTVWKRARHGLSELVGMVIGTIVILALVALSPLFGQPQDLKPTNSVTPSPTPTQTYTIAPTTKWHPLLKQLAPNCNNPKGVAWYVHLDGTFEKCSGSALLMQRISPQYYADMELTQINGMTYNQTTFRVQVQVIFQNPGDTGTLAGLLVQTPAQLNAVGGFIFTLSSNGEWQ
ncbi:MAG TPA: hypothetical protein VEP90_14270, partial [Methylomirabilota bacterium]|nr:hypothetical protein [Methylomirabilota bacterium]